MSYTKDEWWHTTPSGARWGWLQPIQFTEQITALSGGGEHQPRAPMIRFSWWVGVGKSTVYRWAEGIDPVPKWVALLLKSMLQLQAGDTAFPVDVEADWLPYSDGANGRQRPAAPLTGETDKPKQPQAIDPRMLDEASSGEGAFMPPP